jgi:hypothetical protein
MLAGYMLITVLFAVWAAWAGKRPAILLAPIPYLFLLYINAYLFIETFTLEVIVQRKTIIWFKPDRIAIPTQPL